ncbi:Major facilitator super domain-containing protein 12, partial [Desmophyllum pertusum]
MNTTFQEAIAKLPLVVLISATITSGITKKIVVKIGSKAYLKRHHLISVVLHLGLPSVIGAALLSYFISQSTRSLIYLAAVLLGFGLSATFINALSFAVQLVGDNKSTSGFVFAFINLMGNLTSGSLISAIQKLFP